MALYDSSSKLLALLGSEEEVQDCQPDFALIARLDKNLIITAKGNKVDFVSRFFAPKSRIYEDSVTGSAHSVLIPFWSKKIK